MIQPDHNSSGLVPVSGRQLAAVGNLPAIFLRSEQ
jgi:hypothetical protein